MNQYRKNSCLYHPQSIITNFCKDKHCLMPLCPACISQHTQYHEDKQNKPQYTTVNQAFSEMNAQVQSLIFSFEQDKKRNSQLIYRIHELPAIIHEKIVSAKRMTLQIIEEAFSKLEKEVLVSLTKNQEQQDIYSLKRCQIYEENIISKLDQLYYMMASLKTDKALSNLIHFNKEKMNQSSSMHQKISHYLYNNENYSPKIDINTDYARSLTNIIFKMVKPGEIKEPSKKGKQKSRVKSQFVERVQRENVKQQRQMHQNNESSSRKGTTNSRYQQRETHSNTPLKYYNERTVTNQKHYGNRQNQGYVNPDNSPYRNKLVKVQPYSDVYQNEYTNIQHRVSEMKRQNEALEKALRYN